MADLAITADGLAKEYRVGAREMHHALRDTLSRAFRDPLAAFRRKRVETFWALKDVSFEIRQGETVGLIGRNGAGKSTLLKILSRITRPTRGRADLHGRVGSLLEVGTGFHSELTGRENTFLSGAILGMSRREIEAKFDEIVGFAELEKFIDTPVKHYSSGMYVRLAFAVAAHLEPEILLVDEVLAVGDAAFQEKCLGKMNDISGTGRTIILVSHNMGAITQLCKRCILINNGKITADGAPQPTITSYLASFAAEGASAEFSSEGKAGSPGVIRRIWIADEEGEVLPAVDVKKGFRLGIRILVKQRTSPLDLGFCIYNSVRMPLMTSNMLQSDGAVEQLEPGEHTFLVRVPGNFLAPDLYSVTVALHRPGVEVYDAHEHALTFRVEEFGSDMWRFQGANYGSILVNFDWKWYKD